MTESVMDSLQKLRRLIFMLHGSEVRTPAVIQLLSDIHMTLDCAIEGCHDCKRPDGLLVEASVRAPLVVLAQRVIETTTVISGHLEIAALASKEHPVDRMTELAAARKAIRETFTDIRSIQHLAQRPCDSL